MKAMLARHRTLIQLKKNEKDNGFSFIELVIVVAVIGILTAIAIPSYGGIQTAAKEAAVDAMAKEGHNLALVASEGFGPKNSSGGTITPGEAVKALSTDDIKLELFDSSNAPSGALGAGEICVQATNVKNLEGGEVRFRGFSGTCDAFKANNPNPGGGNGGGGPEVDALQGYANAALAFARTGEVSFDYDGFKVNGVSVTNTIGLPAENGIDIMDSTSGVLAPGETCVVVGPAQWFQQFTTEVETLRFAGDCDEAIRQISPDADPAARMQHYADEVYSLAMAGGVARNPDTGEFELNGVSVAKTAGIPMKYVLNLIPAEEAPGAMADGEFCAMVAPLAEVVSPAGPNPETFRYSGDCDALRS